MCLLSELLSNTENQLIFIQLLNGQSILPRLLPFLCHPNLSVKQTTLSTLNKIISAIDRSNSMIKFEQIESEANLARLLRLLFQQAILMSSDTHFKQLETILVQLWRTVCASLSSRLIVSICFPYITTWLYLLMWPPNQQIEHAYLLPTHDVSIRFAQF